MAAPPASPLRRWLVSRFSQARAQLRPTPCASAAAAGTPVWANAASRDGDRDLRGPRSRRELKDWVNQPTDVMRLQEVHG